MADLEREFLSPPEGAVGPDAMVVKPSLWAGIGMVGEVLAVLLPFIPILGIPLLVYADRGMSGPWWIVLLDRIELAYGLLFAFAPVVKVAFTRYTFDDEGIRVRVQILSRTDQRVTWEKVTALRHRRTLLDRLFKMGRIDVIAYGERGATLKLVGLRDSDRLRGLVAQRMRESASVASLFRSD